MRIFGIHPLMALSLLMATFATTAPAQQLGVAGSPVSSIQDRNYSRLFQNLVSNGIKLYFPTFQYVEVPRAKSLGFESDFAVPCSPNDPAFRAVRESGIKLILPGELVYPRANRIGRGSRANDPLVQLINCAGRNNIAGISNYDEAADQGRSINDVAKFYAHVKSIDPSLPVLMVHGPIITDKPQYRSVAQIQKYLNYVQAYSAHADIVGFDVYPVPAFLAKVATPMSKGREVAVNQAVVDYMRWLKQAVPGKPKLMVLQGFAYTNLYDKKYREANVPASLLATIKPPSRNETELMLKQARDQGVQMVIWWGVASLPNTQTEPWPSILGAGRKFGR